MNKNKLKINGKTTLTSTKRDLIFYCLLLVLPLTQLLIFYFIVNFQSFGMAFQTYTTEGEFVWDISYNLTELSLYSKYLWAWAKNSILVWLVTSFFGTVLAVIFSYYIYKKRLFCNIFKFVLFLPSVIPGILLGIMFYHFVGSGIPAYTRGALINIFDTPALKATYGENAVRIRFWVMTFYTAWISFGSQVLVYTGAMDQIPTEVIEAGQLDGVSFMRELRSIVFPSILPSVGTFLIAGVAGLFSNQNNLFNIMGMNTNIDLSEQTVGYFLYSYVLKSAGKTGYTFASFLGLCCTLIVLPISFGVRKLVERALK